MGKPLNVLIVEDSEDDTHVLLRELRRGGFEPEFERVDTAEALSTALDGKTWDVLLCDHNLPRFNVPAALTLVKAAGLDLP
ncbi:MAG: two-component system response regulator, partial [Nitrospiraceae bacterium]